MTTEQVQSEYLGMNRALVVVNLLGFINFLRNDFDLLGRMGYEFEIAANGKMADGTDAVEVAQLASAGIAFHHVDLDTKSPLSPSNLRAYRQLREIVRQGGYELVCCHTPIAGMLARLAAQRGRRVRGTKVIYTTHGFTFCKGASRSAWAVFFPVEYVLSALCDAIVTINREDFLNARKMLCKKVYQLPGVGVDVGRMSLGEGFDRATYREELGVSSSDVVVLAVGELSARKNHRLAIEALGLIPDRERYVLVICGRDVTGSGTAEALSRQAEKLGVRVKLMGHRHDIPEMNNCADVAVIPSLREGLGLAGIEALAAGVPVVGSDVQGIRDYVVPGETGYLVSPHDAQGFARAIEDVASMSDVAREEVASRCRAMAERFSRKRSFEALSSIYAEVL